MRNLKRALSLGLTATMLSGMMVAGAGAASYADVTSANNEKAIDVLKAVGVMTGDDKGNFNPDQKVTRAEMAVIMANMLDLDVDNFGSASIPFTDVPSWAVPYVAACYADGITSGTSATTYGSNDTVTTVQAALMMLKALGYFQYASDFGADWSLATIRQASSIGLFDGIKAGSKDAMTRDEVAQLSLNTLESTMVQASKTGNDIIIGDIVIGGNVTYDEVTSGSDYAKAMSQEKKDGSYTVQLGEKLYDGNLKVQSTTTDDFGRPSEKWSYKTTEIGNYAKTADVTYTGEVKSKDLYSDLGLSNSTKATVTEDGKGKTDFTVAKGNGSKLLNTANGTVTEAYVNDNGDVTIAVMNVYGGEVTKVADAKDGDAAYVVVDGMKYETEGYAVDDVVYYTKADDEIKSLAKASVTEGVTVTRINGDEFTADGTTYKLNVEANNQDSFKSDIQLDSVLDVYTDGNGFVIDVNVSKTSKDYAYILGLKNDGYTGSETTTAKLLLSDGTVVEVKLQDAITTDLEKATNKLVEYTKNSKDEYKFVTTGDQVDTGVVEIEKGKAAMNLGNKTYYANSKTVFLVQTGEGNSATYTSYTGYENVPNLKNKTDGNYAVLAKTGNVANIVFVSNVANSSDDILYVLSSKKGTEIRDTDAGTYYEYKAVLNGELVTVKMDDRLTDAEDAKADVLFSSIAYADKDNEILDTSACIGYTSDSTEDAYAKYNVEVTSKVKDGVIGLGADADNDPYYYTVSKDVQAFAVYNGDKIETGSTSDIAVGEKITVIVKNGEIVSIFYGEASSSNPSDGDAVVEKVELAYASVEVPGQEKPVVVDVGAFVTFDKPATVGDHYTAELMKWNGTDWVLFETYDLEVGKLNPTLKLADNEEFWSFADVMTTGQWKIVVDGVASKPFNPEV